MYLKILIITVGLRRTVTTITAVSNSKLDEDLSTICAKLPAFGDNENVSLASTDASLRPSVPEEATKLPVPSKSQADCAISTYVDVESGVSIPMQNLGDARAAVDHKTDSLNYANDWQTAKESTMSRVLHESRFKEGTPEMFTSKQFDSTIWIRLRMSKEPTPSGDADTLCFTGLPYEMLVRIASFLDSFSLCNLSLTCWLLRDVCRSLLRHRGLVVLEWQKDCSRIPPRWKVSHKVSLSFSVCCLSVILEGTFRVIF